MLSRRTIRDEFETRVRRAPVLRAAGAVIGDWREIAGRLPAPGENTLIVTRRAFSAFEFVPILLSGPCERLLVTTYNMSLATIGMLEQLVSDGRVVLADVLVSESMQRLSDGGAVVEQLAGISRMFRDRFRFRALDIHAKIICMAMEDGPSWVVEGSGNMARNTSIETYSIFDDPGRLAFHASWIGGCL